MQPTQPDRPGSLAFHPSRLVLTIERDERGALLFRSPHLPDWRRVARGSLSIAHAIAEAFREYGIRAYANGRGETYRGPDLAADDVPTCDEEGEWERVSPSSFRGPDGRLYRVVAEWRELDDGDWLSPAGRRYSPETEMVQRVIASRT